MEFQAQIKEIYFDSKQRYGAPKIQKVLESQGIKASLKRVQRHMAKQGLRSIVVKKYNHHSSKAPVGEVKTYLIVNLRLLQLIRSGLQTSHIYTF